ncbi:MAG: DUF2828 family protein [Rickettsiales bacterium]|nr:MAG: DUF2828 family protein [Rickettsiales bacterium]
MNKFVDSVERVHTLLDNTVYTENGMRAKDTTKNPCLDLFFKIGASRGKNILDSFIPAYNYDEDLTLKIVLWSRDIRQGAGERDVFNQILKYLAMSGKDDSAKKLMNKVPELGRYKDLFINYDNLNLQNHAFSIVKKALFEDKNGLAAKWTPRKGEISNKFRKYLEMSPKEFRKMLVGLSSTVEQSLSSKNYSEIDYSKLPSLASSRYQSCFNRVDHERYSKFKESLKKDSKINSSALYPYDIIKSLRNGGDALVSLAQWESLPDYTNGCKILPVVDVSESMYCPAGNNPNLRCIDIAISLGLYLSDKNKSDFKDMFLTFSTEPQLNKLHGNLIDKISQLNSSDWGMSTDISKSFDLILNHAKSNNVPQEDMPEAIIILSDMQFNECDDFEDNETAYKVIKNKYKLLGYSLPKLIFWNLNAHDNFPVRFDKNGTCLVSGFSPSILKSILSGKNISPIEVMLETVMIDRYDLT